MRVEHATFDADRRATEVEARLLKLQKRAGRLSGRGPWRLDEKRQEFRGLTPTEKVRSEMHSLLAEIEHTREPGRLDVLRRKLRLVASEL